MTTYLSDDFGRMIQEASVIRKQQNVKWFPDYETQPLSTYDIRGNDLVYMDQGEDNAFRDYQPYLGGFLTRDTYTGDEEDPLNLHLYSYWGNDIGGIRYVPRVGKTKSGWQKYVYDDMFLPFRVRPVWAQSNR